MSSHIQVFISYAWESDSYREWVRSLATQLREDGVNARLDYWHLEEGQTIPGFMNSEVADADIVLILCSPVYRDKIHAMDRGELVTGSGWEGMLVTSSMFVEGKMSKYIPVLTKGNWKEAAPNFLLGRPYEDLSVLNTDTLKQNYDRLLNRILGRKDKAPPVESLSSSGIVSAPVPALLSKGLEKPEVQSIKSKDSSPIDWNNFENKSILIDALLKCESINSRETRDAILNELPVRIRNNISRHSRNKVDVANIITACLQYDDGLETFISRIEFYEEDTIAFQKIRRLVNRK